MNKEQKNRAEQMTREIVESANSHYAALKKKRGFCVNHMNPETLLGIIEDHAKATASACAEQIVLSTSLR